LGVSVGFVRDYLAWRTGENLNRKKVERIGASVAKLTFGPFSGA
jgi:hypothetical protein